jgi:FkbM family methyltransferase
MISKIYRIIATIFFKVGYFPGSWRVLNTICSITPLINIRVRHPLGFTWKISTRDSLKTFLSNCEPYTSKLVSQIAPGIDTFICVGANRGWYPMLVRTKNTDCIIFAFECNSKIYLELDENMKENDSNVRLVKKAVGKTFGSSYLFLPKDGNEGMSTLYLSQAAEREASELEIVEVIDLDLFFQSQNLNLGQVLILLDIEGGEMNALRGASELLFRYSPILILEINEQMLEAAGTKVFELLTFLEELGYFVYWIDERERLQPVNQKDSLPHVGVLPSGTGANYLCTRSLDLIKDIQ